MIPEKPPDDYMDLLEAERTVQRICRENKVEILIRGAPSVQPGTSGSHLWIRPGYNHRIYSDGYEELTYQAGSIRPEQVRIGKPPIGSAEYFDEMRGGGRNA